MAAGAPSLTTRATRGRMVATTVTVVLRVASVLLLVVSAVAGVQAAWSRFAVCFVDTDPPVAGLPEDGARGCVALQDHMYDYTLPSDPWVPIADAAQREGVSLLALGIAVVLVSVSVACRWPIRVLTAATGAALGAMWLAVGTSTLRGGLAAEPESLPVAVGPLLLLVPLVTSGLALVSWRRGAAGLLPDGRSVSVFWAAMTVAQPLPEFFITLALWGSHDTSPLAGLFRCAAVVAAAAAVATTLVPDGPRQRFLVRPLRRVGRGLMRALSGAGPKVER